jgi:putative hemolysin
MNTLIAAICALALAGCASTHGKQPNAASSADKSGVASRLAETTFEETGGTLNLVFDAQGNWVKLTTKGTAAMTDDTPAARETTLAIATLRARQMVATFLSSELGSGKTMTRLVRNYTHAYPSSDNTKPIAPLNTDDEAAMRLPADTDEDRHAQQLATTLTEHIRDNSSAILKGAYVSGRSIDGAQAVVELTVSRASIDTARQISVMMRGALQ